MEGSDLSMKRVIIIGAGLGGLAAGIKLVAAGFDVMMIEKNSHAGGKMMPVQLGDYSFDFGPNTITMPFIFQNVLKEVGENPDNYFQFEKIIDHTLNWYPDGSQFLQTTDHEKMKENLALIDSYSFQHYDQYVLEVKKLYSLAEQSFFYQTFTSLKDYLSPALGMAFMKVRPLESMHHFHQRFFQDPRVLMAFDRYATYIGSSPYKCPATFSLIGHLEMNDGVYYTKGGNPTIATGFEEVFKKLGGKLFLNTKVDEILVKDQRAVGVRLGNGEKIGADLVIVNGDLLSAHQNLLKEIDRPRMTNEKIAKFEPSISAFVIMAGVNKPLPQLQHHQVFFTSDYRQEFKQLFLEKSLPDDPTIYICNSAATEPERTKGSNLFILVNAPALENLDEEESMRYKEKIYARLDQTFGLPLKPYIEEEMVVSSPYIKETFSAYKGALYGISSHRKKDAFLRPPTMSRDIKQLHFVGGTTHPGGGSPMVTISGMNVANLIIQQNF